MLYLAAVFEKEGHEVVLRDFSADSSSGEFEAFVNAGNSDVFILHTVLLAESVDKKAAAFILSRKKGKVVFFGPHPTLKPQDFLLDENCFVARGEAEYVIRDTIKAFEKGGLDKVKGLSYFKNGEFIENETYGIIEDLDSLPFPARKYLPKEDIDLFNPKLPARPVTLILTSRGCGFRCYYCVPNAISWARELEWKRFNNGKKPPVRLRSPENIAREFAAIKAEGYKAVSVIDDLFIYGGKKRILEICAGLKTVGLPFGVLARCDLILDDETVAALKEAGCSYVDLGVESLDQKVLDDIKKDMKVESVEKAVRLLNRHGIEPKPNIMFGASAFETVESAERTIREVSKLPVNYCMFSIATPFPGTEFSEKALKEGFAVEPEIHDLEKNLSPTEKALVSYPGLTKDDLERLVKKANRSFYLLSFRRLLHYIGRVRSFKDLKDMISTALKVIK